MKIINIFLIISFVFGLLISSCSEDKGNYNYDWITDYNVTFPTLTNDSIIVQLGDILTLDPIFYDEDGQIQDVDYDEYTYIWTSLLAGNIARDDAKFLSDKYNLNVPITLDIVNGYHTIYFQATHNKTGILYRKYFKIKVVGKFKNAYLFLTEDEDKNADIEFHGKDADGKEVSLSKYLSSLNYPYISGGAYSISFDSPNKRIWISTGSGTGWLTTPTLAFDPITNKLSTYLVPQTANSFVKMYRFGTINATASNRAYVCFTEEGGLHIINNRGMSQNYAIVNDIPVSLAPMTAAANPQKSSILWDTTNKQLVFLSMGSSAAFTPMTRCELLTSAHGGITSGIKECLYLGGSLSTTYLKDMTTIVKDNSDIYWRSDYQAKTINKKSVPENKKTKQLTGTASLGKIDHWFLTLDQGYLYAIANNEIYSYIESQSGGDVEDPGWSKATITDSKNAVIVIEDPISFVHIENYGLGTNKFYIVTYNQSQNISNVYLLAPRTTTDKLEFFEKITVQGKVKDMTYWI